MKYHLVKIISYLLIICINTVLDDFAVGVNMNKKADFPEVSIRPSMLSNPGKLLLGVAIIAFGIPISEYVALESGKDVILETFSVFLFVGSLVFMKVIWTVFNQRFCLCHEYFSSYTGLLGTSLRTTRLLYEHVRGVEIQQSLLQRVFGLGDLHVGSDVSKGEGEMVICGIRNPDKLKDLLLDRVRSATHLHGQSESSRQENLAGAPRGV